MTMSVFYNLNVYYKFTLSPRCHCSHQLLCGQNQTPRESSSLTQYANKNNTSLISLEAHKAYNTLHLFYGSSTKVMALVCRICMLYLKDVRRLKLSVSD